MDVKGRCFLEKHQESIKYPKNFKGSKKIKRPKDDERYTHNFKSQLVCFHLACRSASDPSADALLLQPQGILPFQSGVIVPYLGLENNTYSKPPPSCVCVLCAASSCTVYPIPWFFLGPHCQFETTHFDRWNCPILTEGP